MAKEEELLPVNGALDLLVANVCKLYPEGHNVAVLAKLLTEKVKPGDAIPDDKQAAWAGLVADAAWVVDLFGLAKSLKTYQELGEGPQSRVNNDTGLNIVKALIAAKNNVRIDPLPSSLASHFEKNAGIVLELDGEARLAIQDHGKLYLLKTSPKLEQHFAQLKPMSEGSLDSQSWCKGLSEKSTKAEVLAAASGTLMTLDRDTVMIPKIFECHQESL